MTDAIVRLTVRLAQVKPRVTRTIQVPLAIQLDDLHLTLQEAMGWSNFHLYEFRAAGIGWGACDPDIGTDDMLDAAQTSLADLVERVGAKALHYMYDFGDGWDHTIRIGRPRDPEPGVLYPRLVAAEGRCPPEDVGGPWGYSELIEALADPNHERRADFKYLIDSAFDPTVVDVPFLTAAVAALAESWSGEPTPRFSRWPVSPSDS